MRRLGGLVLGVVVLGAGCYHEEYAYEPGYVAARPVTIAVPPPAPVPEQPPPEPYAGAVWMSGYWDWAPDTGRHVWIPGHWATPPRVGVIYMPPSWRADGRGGWYRVPGRWVAGASRDAYGRHIAYDSYGRPHYF
jgi:WXXGXW repeat (2 copies)